MGFNPVFATETPPLDTNKTENKQTQTAKSSKQSKPAKKISLNYQINDQPIATVETTEDKPFTILSEIFHKTLDTANQTLGKVVNTVVHIPYPEEMQKSFKEKLPNFVLHTLIETPQGKTKTDFNWAAFGGKINESKKEGTFEWGGLNGSLNYTGILKGLNGNLAIPRVFINIENDFEMLLEKFALSLSLNDFFEPLHFNLQLPLFKATSKENKDNFSFVLNNLNGKLVSDEQEILEGLRLGRSSFGIDEISFSTAKDQVVLKGLAGETVALINDPTTKKFVNVSSKLGLNNLTLSSSLANGLTNINFELQTSLNNLDAQVLSEIKKTLRQAQSQDFSPDMIGMMLVGDLMKALPRVIKGSPEMDISNFAIRTNQGELAGSFSVGIDGKKPFSMEKIEVLKMAIKAQSSMRISKDMLRKILVLTLKETKPSTVENTEQKAEGEKPKKKAPPIKPEKMADEQIKQFIAQKFLVEEAQHYKLDAEFKGGKLFLNSQEIPLPF